MYSNISLCEENSDIRIGGCFDMTMLNLSDHIVAVAKQNNLPITNLQLQKVMYFVIKDYLSKNGQDEFIKNIYDDPFETWQYGPVVPDLYFRFSIFGSTPMRIEGKYNEEYKVFDSSISKFLTENVFDLVKKSHEQSFWIENQKNKSEKVEYALGDITGD